jgi:hypothetical protein
MKKLIVLMALAWLMIPLVAHAQGQVGDTGTELLAAAASGNVDRVRQLLDRGANVEVKNAIGATPLMWAAMNGRSEVVELLLERGANVNAATTTGVTGLSAAVSRGHSDVVRMLLERGADVTARDDKGRTPLSIAQAHGYTQIVELLQSQGVQAKGPEVQQYTQKPREVVPPSVDIRPPEGPMGVVTSVDQPENCLRIRSGPGVRYEKIGCANRGETLRLTGRVENGWAQLWEPVQGWVSGAQIRAEGLFPPTQATSGYRGARPEYYYRSDTDAALDRAEREADRTIRRLRSEYPDYGLFFGPRGVIVGPYGIGVVP